MRIVKRLISLMCLLVAFLGACATQTVPDNFGDKLLSLGTAAEGGIFYPIGKGICNVINQSRQSTAVRCIAYTTGGPDYNTQAVDVGDLKLGIVFSALSRSPAPDTLRHVLTIYEGPIAVLVRKGAGIQTVADLAGKRVNVGGPTSGKRLLVDTVFRSANLSIKDLAVAKELETADLVDAFCNNEIDAIIEAFKTPSALYDRLVKQCNAELLQFSPEFVQKLMQDNPKLELIDLHLFDPVSQSNRIRPSVGQKVILVARKDTDAEAVHRFLKTLLADPERIKTINPALSDFDLEKALRPVSGFSSHEGVKRYLGSTQAKGEGRK